MEERGFGSADVWALLAALEDAPPVAAADVVGNYLADVLGADEVSLMVADLSGRALVRLRHGSDAGGELREQGQESAERIPLGDTPQGRALIRQQVEVDETGDGSWIFAPVTNRGEAIGVLELRLPHPPDRETVAQAARAAHLLAYVVIANRRFTDLYEWGQRSRPLSLGAEIQRRLLPASYTCEAGEATIAGWLQPAGEIAGDTFDFSLERETLHLSITDAMGHKVAAALLATTLVGALRNGRRGGQPLDEQANLASEALLESVDGTGFVTGQIVRIALGTGLAHVVNAGHPAPVRLRSGEVARIPLDPEPPFGAVPGHRYRVQGFPLSPGDRIFFLTDGVLERNAATLDVGAVLAATADQHPRDAVQELMYSLLAATEGQLEDDATVLCLDWHGGHSGRTTVAGANR